MQQDLIHVIRKVELKLDAPSRTMGRSPEEFGFPDSLHRSLAG